MVWFAGLEAPRAVIRPATFARFAAFALLVTACGGRANRHLVGADDDPEGGNGGTAGETTGGGGVPSNPGAGGDGTGVAGADDGGGGGEVPTGCAPLAPRLLRLTFPQILNSIERLAGKPIADELRAELGVGGAHTFPPLAGPGEGSVVDDPVFAMSDAIAERAAKRMSEQMEELTGCAADAGVACVETYLTELAALAYRRTIDDTDVQDVLLVTAEAEAAGATATEVLRTGIYSILSSPSFLYRTEFGANGDAGALTLTGDEVANALAFFLTDAPPDAALVAAVADGSVETPDGLSREVTRLLELPEAQANLARSLSDLLGRANIESVVVNDPAFTSGVRSAMVRELDLFAFDHLFSEPVDALLTSRKTRVNAELSPFYGVAFPPAGVTPDADGFAAVTLPVERSGFLTRAGFLLGVGGSLESDRALHRGRRVSQLVACLLPPSHAEDLSDAIVAAENELAGKSQRERSEYRTSGSPACAGCHALFEPYGIALESFDHLGRSRSMDEVGAGIRDEVSLPAEAGGALVDGPSELASAIAASGSFTRCLTQAYVRYALAEERPELDVTCEVERAVERAEESGEASFSKVAQAIAEAMALGPRSRSAVRRLP